jgi:hypothetical protein
MVVQMIEIYYRTTFESNTRVEKNSLYYFYTIRNVAADMEKVIALSTVSTTLHGIRLIQLVSHRVSDPYLFDTDPDLAFRLITDPDPIRPGLL